MHILVGLFVGKIIHVLGNFSHQLHLNNKHVPVIDFFVMTHLLTGIFEPWALFIIYSIIYMIMNKAHGSKIPVNKWIITKKSITGTCLLCVQV